MVQEIAFGRDIIVFAKKETTPGTKEFPGTGDAIFLTGEPSFKQTRNFIPDAQRRATYSKVERIKARLSPGEWSLSTYIKPSGDKGVAPECGQLLEGLFGHEEVSASQKVEYLLKDPLITSFPFVLPTYTIWYRLGHTVFCNIGCVVNTGDITIKAGNDDDSIVGITFGGFFMKQIRTGTDALAAAAISGATEITVNDARKFMAEGTIFRSVICIGALNNGGSGYEVTAVNYTTNVLTITPQLEDDANVGDVVKGYLPDPSEVGEPVHGRLGFVTFDEGTPVDTPIIAATIGINNNIKMIEDEKKDIDYPDDFIRPAEREVTLSIDCYFRKDVAARWYEVDAQKEKIIKIPAGDTTSPDGDGKRLRFEFPRVQLDTPDLSGAEELVMTMPKAVLSSSSLEDEIKLVFD